MSKVQSLYILSKIEDCECIIQATNDSPITPQTLPYSLVTVLPNDDNTDVQTIRGKYVYGCLDCPQVKEFIYDPANLDPIFMCAGDNLIQKLQLLWLSTPADVQCEILHNSIYPGDTDIQRYINSFTGGMAMTLFTYKMAITLPCLESDECDKKLPFGDAPFGPFNPCSPIQDVTLEVLSRNLYKYYTYLINFSKCIPECFLGKLWLNEVDKTWKIWGMCFKEGPCYHYEVAIYCTLQGFACYIEQATKNVCDKLKELKELIQNGIQEICDKAAEVIKEIEKLCMDFEHKYEKAISTLTCIGMMLLKMLKDKYQYYKRDIVDTGEYYLCELQKQHCKLSDKLVSKQDEIDHKISDSVKRTFSDITERSRKEQDKMKTITTDFNSNMESLLMEKYKVLNNAGQSHIEKMQKHRDQMVGDITNTSKNLRQDSDKLTKEHHRKIASNFSNLQNSMADHYKQESTKIAKDTVKRYLSSRDFIRQVDIYFDERLQIVKQARDMFDERDYLDKISDLERRLADSESMIKYLYENMK